MCPPCLKSNWTLKLKSSRAKIFTSNCEWMSLFSDRWKKAGRVWPSCKSFISGVMAVEWMWMSKCPWPPAFNLVVGFTLVKSK